MENKERNWCFGLAVAALIATSVLARAEPLPRQSLAVLPFEINDTSGEVGPTSRHEEMLARLTSFVGERIAKAGLYDTVPAARVASAIAEVNPGTYLRSCNGCELDIARRAGADAVLIGWFWKVSTLIGTLHVEIKDVASGRTVYAHVFDFRGDNDKAWQRAADYMVSSLSKSLAAQPAVGQ
ncbi:MAG: DUF3280 domain-containing protein [Hyphomicrobium sp.]